MNFGTRDKYLQLVYAAAPFSLVKRVAVCQKRALEYGCVDADVGEHANDRLDECSVDKLALTECVRTCVRTSKQLPRSPFCLIDSPLARDQRQEAHRKLLRNDLITKDVREEELQSHFPGRK